MRTFFLFMHMFVTHGFQQLIFEHCEHYSRMQNFIILNEDAHLAFNLRNYVFK